MTYEPPGLQCTQDLSSLGLSAKAVHRALNATSHVETRATEATGRRAIEVEMMVPMPCIAHTVHNNEHGQRRPDNKTHMDNLTLPG
jgi:hypothetical protein